MTIQTDKLLTARNFGLRSGVSRQRIYQLIEAGRLDTIIIDGVTFIHEKNLRRVLTTDK